MTRRSSEPLRGWFQLADTAAVAAAWMVADLIRLRSGLVPLTAPDAPPFAACLGQLPLVLLAAVVSFRVCGLYEVTRLRRFREETHAVLRGVTVLALAVVAITFAMQSPYRSRGVFLVFGFLAFAFVLGYRRLSWRTLRNLRARGFNQTHALVVGSGRLARRTARSLGETAWLGIRPVAFVEDAHTGPVAELPVLGPIADLPRLVEDHHIEHVFIALPMHRYGDTRRVFDLLSQSLVEVRLVADVPAMAGLSLTTTTLQGMTVIGLRESGHLGVNVVVKRLMDFALSAALVVLLSPLMLGIAVAVRFGSRGPVFYRQERCSAYGRTFRMLKFRTMKVDAEANGPQMTAANDPRRTRVGTFLRETNLDELPQLFNVLWGDMSLVGPRPERPVFVEQFRRTIPNYNARHAVKPGMTGWAQVNGWRGNSSLRRRVQYDLYYIAHWNPAFDLRILVLTGLMMLGRKQRHAY
jgi:exopolysaccharide biosynthesis polyprenyl glycosylphosphotransferase